MNELMDPQLDVLPKLVIETRDDEVVASIVGKRVRGKDAQPAAQDADGKQIEPGDARPAGQYVPFVVIKRMGGVRATRAPMQQPRLLFECYGRDDREAAVLTNACIRALHNRGPRVFANGLGIFNTLVTAGPEQASDPVTQQPFEMFIVEAVATTQGVV
jgi:hypothetical protein